MDIEIVGDVGFCFGVKRCINIVEDLLKRYKPVYSLGSLIHNPLQMRILEEKGLRIIENADELKPNQKIVIRSHGISKDIFNRLKEKGAQVTDATCPNVKRIQLLAEKYKKRGYLIIVIGEKEHPEVKGIIGWGADIAIEKREDLKELDKFTSPLKVVVLMQTTYLQSDVKDFFKNFSDYLYKFEELIIFNTLCKILQRRFQEAKELAKRVDLVLVIGSYTSANTKRLFRFIKKIGKEALLISKKEDLKPKILEGKKKIGITSGTSTPEFLIKEIVSFLKNERNSL